MNVRHIFPASAFVVLLSAFAWAQPVEGLVHIRFVTDVRVFAVMSAANAAGFDLDSNELAGDPVRARLRERIKGLDADLLQRLRSFYQSKGEPGDPVDNQGRYISLALLLNGPPQFQLAIKTEEVPAEAKPMIGFESLVAETWQKGNLEQFWAEVRPMYLEEIEAYRPLIRDMIVQVLRYARSEARISLDRMVHFIPDPLGGYGIVNARNVGETYIVVVGPSRTRTSTMRAIRHEYLHFLIDPLLAKYAGYLPYEEPFMKKLREQPGSLTLYRENFRFMVTESLIETLEARLAGASEKPPEEFMVSAYDRGLILAPYFYEALGKFEARSDALQEFMPVLLDGISWDKEKDRDATMARMRDEVQPRRREEPAPPHADEVRRAEIRNLLNEANKRLQAREFDQAGVLLEQVLKLDGRNPSALFGLAQVAAQDQRLDDAMGLYARAAASAGPNEAWIAAWSLVHRGNILRFQGELDPARLEWSKVLQLQGDLRGASEAATRALNESPQ
jgi:tetratricopeptide (TPR) repeat protein